VKELLGEQARTRVTQSGGAPLGDFLASNATVEGRAKNRAVRIEFAQSHDFPEEPVLGRTCNPAQYSPAGSISDYTHMVMCAERAFPGHSPRQMLSLLRQLYYGHEGWANSSNENWQNVIPCGINMDNPRTTLGAPLFNALKASQVVAGVDMGHVFTGLESMVCPRATVEMTWNGISAGEVNMPNEEFASWGGDLGSAAARKVHDREDRGRNLPWTHYFLTPGSLASAEDLEGDIDSYAIRKGLSGSDCSRTARSRLPSLSSPISEMLTDYYAGAQGGLAEARGNQKQCFIQALGGNIVGSSITNKWTLIDRIRPRIFSFAEAFYKGLRLFPPSGRGVPLLQSSRQITERFVDWLETFL
jgi:hypothetical protein